MQTLRWAGSLEWQGSDPQGATLWADRTPGKERVERNTSCEQQLSVKQVVDVLLQHVVRKFMKRKMFCTCGAKSNKSLQLET